MKKLLLIASILLATSAFADKVGVVDSQRAFFQFSETKKAQQALEGQAKKVENEARQKEVALQKEFVSLQAKGDKLTDAEKKAFEKKSQDFQAFLNASQDKLNKEQMTKLKRIEDIYEKAVKKVAAEGKYDYVFEADALKVGGEDITDKVLKQMEALK
ncbi:OmpH family outer membrane protein [Fusobacterium sp. 27098_8_59]|uniref:OmpH family outer membrane protein n=1 Tax=Fusobacterium sp. 27098_8_59 TaxID=3003691 RepID=UPI00352E556B